MPTSFSALNSKGCGKYRGGNSSGIGGVIAKAVARQPNRGSGHNASEVWFPRNKVLSFFCGAEYYRLQLTAVPNIVAEIALDYRFSREIEVSKTITAAEAVALMGESLLRKGEVL